MQIAKNIWDLHGHADLKCRLQFTDIERKADDNDAREGKKKQNLHWVRYDVDGEPQVFLIAIQDIHQGEHLYYDYNAFQKEYPTQHLVWKEKHPHPAYACGYIWWRNWWRIGCR